MSEIELREHVLNLRFGNVNGKQKCPPLAKPSEVGFSPPGLYGIARSLQNRKPALTPITNLQTTLSRNR
jgi:hypothetical protein